MGTHSGRSERNRLSESSRQSGQWSEDTFKPSRCFQFINRRRFDDRARKIGNRATEGPFWKCVCRCEIIRLTPIAELNLRREGNRYLGAINQRN